MKTYLKGRKKVLMPARVAWQHPESAGEVVAQREFKEIGELVKSLEKTRADGTLTYNKLVIRIVNKLDEKSRFFSPELLTALAGRKEDSIRLAVARHPSTPKEVLMRLAQDTSDSVRDSANYRLYPPVGLSERRKEMRKKQ